MAPVRCCFDQTAVWHSDAARGPSTPSFDHLSARASKVGGIWTLRAARRSGAPLLVTPPGAASPHHEVAATVHAARRRTVFPRTPSLIAVQYRLKNSRYFGFCLFLRSLNGARVQPSRWKT